MDVLAVVVVAFWGMLPAYVPNNVAVLAGGGAPIDGGRAWRGRRLLGDGKTWRGTAAGIVAGGLLAAVMNWLRPAAAAAVGIGLPYFPAGVAIALPVGAMLGDIVASFGKRRTGRERGAAFPVVDQLDFAAGALVLAAVVDPPWFGSVFTVPVLVAVVVLTPALHLLTNGIAFALGLKDEPW